MQLSTPASRDYVPGPEHPASPDYRMMRPWRTIPQPADASRLAQHPSRLLIGDEEPSDEETLMKRGGGGIDEEGEHLAPADSPVMPIVDPVPSAGDTEAFETDESAPTPRPPQIRIPFAQTRLRRARKSVRPEPPMSASMEARIAETCLPHIQPQLPFVSLPVPLPSPLTTSPTDTGAPLGYRAAEIRMRAADASPPLSLLPTSPRTDIPEAEMPPRKRACLTTPAPGYEIGESSAAGAARQPGHTPALDTWDEIVEAMMELAPTTLEGVDQRVTELDTTVRQRTEEFEIRFEEAHDDRAYLGALVNTLYRERLQHRRTALAIDREALYARIAWTSSEERSATIRHMREDKCLLNENGSYTDFLKCPANNFKTLRGVVGLNPMGKKWNLFSLSALINIAPWDEIKCWKSEYWRLEEGERVTDYDDLAINDSKKLALMCDRMFPEESAKVERYVGGLPDMIHGSVKASKPQTMQEAIEFATEMMDKKMTTAAERQAENKRRFEEPSRNTQNQQQPFKRNNTGHSARDCKVRPTANYNNNNNNNNQRTQGTNPRVITCFECGLQGHYRNDCPKLKNGNQGNRAGNGNAVARAYVVGSAGTNPNSNVVTAKYHAVIVCDEKLVRVPFGDKILIFHGDGSNNGHESRLNIISCTKAQKYLLEGCPIFLAQNGTYRHAPSEMEGDVGPLSKNFFRQRLYKTQFLTLGSSGLVCQEEGRILPDVYRLPGIE
ncbi:putative reverse transcriptase domain-containing protein [Tanacetum coccineum]